jgi:hypothetical protein
MKKLCLLLALLLALPYAASAGAAGTMMLGGGGSGISYLLRAWPTGNSCANQDYTNGQVLDTVGECVYDGSLRHNETLEVYSISTNTLKLISTVNNYTDQSNIVSITQITSSIGVGLFCTLSYTSGVANNYCGFSDSSNSDIYTAKNNLWRTEMAGASGDTGENSSNGMGNYSVGISTVSTSTNYSTVTILGGYNSSGVPYKIGDTKSSFGYGASHFWKSPTTSWRLAWKDYHNNDATVYPYLTHINSGTFYWSNLLVPVLDLSSILQPLHLSTFASSAELDAYVPDSGGSWTEDSGDWDTDSTKVVATTAGLATFDAGVAYAMYDAAITLPGSGTSPGGLIMKYKDADEFWYAKITPGTEGTDFELIQFNGDAGTQRASADVDWAVSTTYSVRIISSSYSPYWRMFVNGVERVTGYATNGEPSANTLFGLKDEGNSNLVFDNVALWPFTSTTYDTAFAQVGY